MELLRGVEGLPILPIQSSQLLFIRTVLDTGDATTDSMKLNHPPPFIGIGQYPLEGLLPAGIQGLIIEKVGNIEGIEAVITRGVDDVLGPFDTTGGALDHDMIGVGAVAGPRHRSDGGQDSLRPKTLEGATGVPLLNRAETELVV